MLGIAAKIEIESTIQSMSRIKINGLLKNNFDKVRQFAIFLLENDQLSQKAGRI